AVEFVIVFFLLSGFSIAHSLSENRSPLPFYKRRFIRIYPSYVVALVWAGLIFIITKALFPVWYDGSLNSFSFIRTVQMNNFFDWDIILKNLFYMPSEGFITPFWSLTYEVIFYLLAPFLLRNVNVYVIVSILLFLLNLVTPEFVQGFGLHPYIFSFLFVYNIYFAAGVFLYKNFDKIMQWFSPISKRIHFFLILVALGLMYAVNFYLQTESSYSFIIAGIFSWLLIFYFLKYQVRVKWLMQVGKFSYTLYITHLASIFLYLSVYWLIAKPTEPFILNYFVWMPAVLFCLLIAWIQYLLVESKTKSILSRLRRDNKPA
ncbi:MAG: acyltransferase, partial [Chitinophagaceae bacterium]|nr:acyltransferase [Chitinophagaceae bacterium]